MENEVPRSPEEEFLTLVPLVERISRFVARRNGLPGSDVEDLAQQAKLKLVEHDYAALRTFSRRCRIDTYLTAIISNLCKDALIRTGGKWRPSAEATRLGPVAELLEELTVRSGYSVDEAWQIITTNHQLPVTRAELERIAGQLPRRSVRRFVPVEELEHVSVGPGRPDEALERAERSKDVARALEVMRRVIAAQSVEDQLIMAYRWEDSLTVADIARIMRKEQKPLYRRLESMRSRLRDALEAEGIDPGVIDRVGDDR